MTKVMNVAMIGGGFMGKAHAMAYASMPMFFWPAPAIPHRKVVVDVTDGMAEEARRRYGFDEASSTRCSSASGFCVGCAFLPSTSFSRSPPLQIGSTQSERICRSSLKAFRAS